MCSPSLIPQNDNTIYLELSEMLPDMYGMDNFFECVKKEKENVYCKVHASLHPTNSSSAVWNLIEERRKLNQYYFDRSQVFRMICVPKDHSASSKSIEKYSQEVLNGQFDKSVFTFSINSINCFESDHYWNYPPYLQHFVVGVLLYIAWLIFATIYEIWATEKGSKYKANEWIMLFSLRKNWNILTLLKQNDDAVKLQCLQGVRGITVICIIFFHAQLVMSQLFLRNAEYVEAVYQNTVLNVSLRISLFIVQSFFLLSSWLLTNYIYDIYHKNGEFTIKDCCFLLINRIFRLWPTLILMEIVVMQSMVFYYNPQVSETVNMVKDACYSNWWITLLFFDNFYKFSDVCCAGTWYLSADTQLFISTLILCYVVLKFKLDMKKVLGILIPLSIFVFAAIKYYYNLAVISPMTPSTSLRHIFWNDVTHIIQYTNPFANWTTNFIGVVMGYTYYYTKDKQYNFGTQTQIFWVVSFLVLPIVLSAIAASQSITSRLGRAIVGALLKPLYSVGIAIGLMGMVHGIGGPIKALYECKLFNVLGNMSFSIYICHFLPTFLRGLFTFELFYVQAMEVILYQIGNLLLCITLGATFCLIWEQPFSNLQKKIFLQLIRQKNAKQVANDTQKKE